jgi:Peptidase family S41
MKTPIFSALYFIAILSLLSGCSSSLKSFSPNKKFSAEQLREDYTLFRKILEDVHPSLYWYSPKDTIDHYFDEGYLRIKDSMTESGFRSLLSYVLAKVNCGHTTARYSSDFNHYLEIARLRTFPLSVKIWGDTMVVTANLNRKDSILKRGTPILSINGRKQQGIVDSLSKFISSDGFNEVAKYQQLSNRGTFAGWYRNIYGLSDKFTIEYIDSSGNIGTTIIPVYDPAKDTAAFPPGPRIKFSKKEIRRQRRFVTRNLQVDTLLNTAYMTLGSFSRGNKLNSFFKRSFKLMKKRKIDNLVIDVRGNGGGDASLSTLLTRYMIDHSFKIADSLYATRRSTNYGKYIDKQFLYWVGMQFVTRRRSDGRYHFGYFERHHFKPMKKYHYAGKVYILTGGNSFSATTLFASALKGQKNVLIVGEETGGAAYGNTAWMIPDARLPNTRMGFRLPKFRLVMDRHGEKNGRGVEPDVFAGPSVQAIREGIDYKIEKVRELIEADSLKPKK